MFQLAPGAGGAPPFEMIIRVLLCVPLSVAEGVVVADSPFAVADDVGEREGGSSVVQRITNRSCLINTSSANRFMKLQTRHCRFMGKLGGFIRLTFQTSALCDFCASVNLFLLGERSELRSHFFRRLFD